MIKPGLCAVGSYPIDMYDGVLVYNGSDDFLTDTDLNSGKHYFYRAWAYNSVTGKYSTNFSQDNEYTRPGDPSNFNAYDPTSDSIKLSWTKGVGSDKTRIMRKTGEYPQNKNDGTLVYFDTGEYYMDVNLNPSTTYFYRAWAYDTDSEYYSSGFDEDKATTSSNSNQYPVLSTYDGWPDGVDPDFGSSETIFSFKVHYFDEDGDSPSVKQVVIDDQTYSMSGSGSDSDYSFSKSGFGSGDHSYYFYFEDGNGGYARLPSSGEWEFSVDDGPFTLIHLTDPHIGAPGAADRFIDVLNHVVNLPEKPDGILISGDLVDWGCYCMNDPSNIPTMLGVFNPKDKMGDSGYLNYLVLNEIIYRHVPSDIFVSVCPGNHDYRLGYRSLLFWHPYFPILDFSLFSIFNIFNYKIIYSLKNYCELLKDETNYDYEYKNTQIISLNSGHDTVDTAWDAFTDILGYIVGEWDEEALYGTGLSDNQINFLEDTLDSTSAENKIIFMHHPAVNDILTISNNNDEFINICEDNKIKVVLSGHTHNSCIFDSIYGTFYNHEPQEDDPPLLCNKTYFVQTQDCGQDHISYRKIIINDSIVLICRYENLLPLVNLYISGPADIHTYDSKGNHIGIDEDGKSESEINGATYGHLDTGEEFASIYYGKDEYRFDINGNDDGVVSIKLRIIEKNGSLTEINYENFFITKNTKASLYIYKDSIDKKLILDFNCDGEIEKIVNPISPLQEREKYD